LKIHNWLTLVSSLVIGITLVFSGCEGERIDSASTTDNGTPPDTVPTNTVPTNTAPTNIISTVLNDDPNCDLVIKYQGHAIENEGQVHYVNRVLTSEPFGSVNPVCVQYNDTQTGEVTVWKDQSSRGQQIDILPRDRGIDKIVVWYE